MQPAINSGETLDESRDVPRLRLSKAAPEESLAVESEQPRPSLRILIADRDSMSSDLLAGALSRDPRCEAAAVPQADLLDGLAGSDVDVVVIGAAADSDSEGGFDLAAAIGTAYPGIYVVLLVDKTSYEVVVNALRSGVRGIFSRQLPMADFLDCIEHVGKGMMWLGRDETSSLLKAFKSIPAPNVLSSGNSPALTTRELQVVKCAAKGMTNKVIAGELRLSEHTVKNYLFRAFEKLGVSSRVELLFYLTIRGHKFDSVKPESVDSSSNLE